MSGLTRMKSIRWRLMYTQNILSYTHLCSSLSKLQMSLELVKSEKFSLPAFSFFFVCVYTYSHKNILQWHIKPTQFYPKIFPHLLTVFFFTTTATATTTFSIHSTCLLSVYIFDNIFTL
jgi:hypothetical protein